MMETKMVVLQTAPASDMNVTKNIETGDRITSLDYLMSLARERKSVVVYVGGAHFVRPAAFVVNWPLSMIVRMRFYHAVKKINAPENSK
jgi:hypothetical protein